MSEPHRSSLGRLGSAAGTVLIILVVSAAVFAMAAPVFGWRVDTVLSGSMEPALSTGDVVVTMPVAAGTIRAGDIVTYSSLSGRSYTTHRVVAVETEPELRFITKGDANRGPDPSPILPGQVAGIVALHLPYLGLLFAFIRTPIGLVLTIAIPALIIIASEVESRWVKGAE